MPTSYELTSCPACGVRDEREIADADAIKAELEALWAFHERRLDPAAPPERLADRVAFSQRPPLRLAQCRRCTLLYRNPRERAQELVETYASEAPDERALESLLQNQQAAYRGPARRLLAAAGRRGKALEVGSYVGAFLAAARELTWDVEGIDVNARTAAFARARGFRVEVADLDGFAEHAAANRQQWDVVAIWNTFEQLPDPRRAASLVRGLLRPGGTLAVRVPNGACYVTLRRMLNGPLAPAARTFLAHSNLLGFPYRHGFTPHALTGLLRDAGFGQLRLVGDSLVPTGDRWTRLWARVEERAIKLMLRTVARSGRLGVRFAPWLEGYARVN